MLQFILITQQVDTCESPHVANVYRVTCNRIAELIQDVLVKQRLRQTNKNLRVFPPFNKMTTLIYLNACILYIVLCFCDGITHKQSFLFSNLALTPSPAYSFSLFFSLSLPLSHLLMTISVYIYILFAILVFLLQSSKLFKCMLFVLRHTAAI